MDIHKHVGAVLLEEVRRQRRKPGEVSRAAGVSKNTLYAVRSGAEIGVNTLWALADALEVPVSEIAFRVDAQRRNGQAPEHP